jgi:hypothetical protein
MPIAEMPIAEMPIAEIWLMPTASLFTHTCVME